MDIQLDQLYLKIIRLLIKLNDIDPKGIDDRRFKILDLYKKIRAMNDGRILSMEETLSLAKSIANLEFLIDNGLNDFDRVIEIVNIPKLKAPIEDTETKIKEKAANQTIKYLLDMSNHLERFASIEECIEYLQSEYTKAGVKNQELDQRIAKLKFDLMIKYIEQKNIEKAEALLKTFDNDMKIFLAIQMYEMSKEIKKHSYNHPVAKMLYLYSVGENPRMDETKLGFWVHLTNLYNYTKNYQLIPKKIKGVKKLFGKFKNNKETQYEIVVRPKEAYKGRYKRVVLSRDGLTSSITEQPKHVVKPELKPEPRYKKQNIEEETKASMDRERARKINYYQSLKDKLGQELNEVSQRIADKRKNNEPISEYEVEIAKELNHMIRILKRLIHQKDSMPALKSEFLSYYLDIVYNERKTTQNRVKSLQKNHEEYARMCEYLHNKELEIEQKKSNDIDKTLLPLRQEKNKVLRKIRLLQNEIEQKEQAGLDVTEENNQKALLQAQLEEMLKEIKEKQDNLEENKKASTVDLTEERKQESDLENEMFQKGQEALEKITVILLRLRNINFEIEEAKEKKEEVSSELLKAKEQAQNELANLEAIISKSESTLEGLIKNKQKEIEDLAKKNPSIINLASMRASRGRETLK